MYIDGHSTNLLTGKKLAMSHTPKKKDGLLLIQELNTVFRPYNILFFYT